MGRRNRPDRWKIKLVSSVIRSVRGKPLLEALYNLQDGRCAYDLGPCALLLPPTTEFQALGLRVNVPVRGTGMKLVHRLATMDHVTPRARGGTNDYDNLLMASQLMNGRKGMEPPTDRWEPKIRRHSPRVVNEEILRVEAERWNEAVQLARHVHSKQDAKRVVVEYELDRLLNGPFHCVFE